MKVVPIESVPVERLEQPRAGVFLFQRLLEGEEGSDGNFSLELVKTFNDFFSPRHRHNFDQVRFQVEGMFDFGKSGKMRPGMVGYFPESTRYGPQTSTADALLLVLQFAGASRARYMSKTQLGRGVSELKAFGTFENGIYTVVDEQGRKRNRDSYEAVWEHVFGQPLAYAASRYNDAILIDPEGFAWMPRQGEPGVTERLLGVFTERRTELAFVRLEPGARHRAPGGRIYFVTSGQGRAGGAEWAPRTTIHVAEGEDGVFEARATSEMLTISFPSVVRETTAERSLAMAK
jgi:hypothetical protein